MALLNLMNIDSRSSKQEGTVILTLAHTYHQQQLYVINGLFNKIMYLSDLDDILLLYFELKIVMIIQLCTI